jgi:hypothetical protein
VLFSLRPRRLHPRHRHQHLRRQEPSLNPASQSSASSKYDPGRAWLYLPLSASL